MTGARLPDERVGVVVITRDRREELLRTLAAVTALPEAPPVVVVDNDSSDGTADAVVNAGFTSVTLLRAGRNLGAVGRNVGTALLDRPYVAFCDDDTWWAPGALSRAADVLDHHPSVAVVTGRILVEPGGRDDPINAELADSPLPPSPGLPGPRLGSFLAGASMVRRAPFLGVGGFERRLLIGGEEQLLAADLASGGWELIHVSDVVVHHQPSTARDADRRRRQGIRNHLWFLWLRRPVPAALRRTVHLLRTVPRDRVTAVALLNAAAGAAWVVRHRRPVPPEVEAGYRLLDRPQMRSTATRHVS
jgi:GT2 family glycosyltransferase